MSPETGTKRYVVTFSDPQIGKEAVSNLLNVSTEQVEDGLSVMASDRTISSADILFFDNIGTSVVSLTEAQMTELRNREDVLEVVEDFEMHALALPKGNGQTEYLDMPLDSGFDTLPDTGTGLDTQQLYMMGYTDGYKAMQDKVAELIGTPADRQTGETPAPPTLKPIAPTLPTLPRPIPFPPILLRQPIPWNINLVKAPAAWKRGITGAGVKVAVIDTGIATHTDLIVSGGASFVSGVVSFNDDNGHGTHCAGIIGARNNAVGVVGVAPQCSLFAVKVLNSAGSGAFSQIIAGMSWALQNKMNVVSMSLGANVPLEGAPVALKAAVQQLLNAGITVVAAAGNSFGSSFPFVGTPGNIPGVIAVGAVDINSVIASFSSRGGTGNQVTISAPGVSVTSTFALPPNAYKSLSGTSMACPHVAGAVALVKQKFPFLTPAQIQAKLRGTATDLGVPGTDTTYGSGLINCDAATL